MKSFALILVLVLSFAVLTGNFLYAGDSAYQIGTGDVLRVTVYDHPDLNTIARVDDVGSIIFPLAGQVTVGGMTATDAARTIASKLSGDYIINPQVSVFVEEFRSKKVVVIGEVIRPGVYELSGPTTLLELVSKAGGLTRGAGQSATIHRTSSREQVLTVDLANIYSAGGDSSDLQLMDGDTVTIERAGLVYVTGQVNRPAAYSLEPNMTVIKAITMAGGFTALAAQGRIKIIRKIDGAERVLERVSLHDRLAPDDVMVIPESFF